MQDYSSFFKKIFFILSRVITVRGKAPFRSMRINSRHHLVSRDQNSMQEKWQLAAWIKLCPFLGNAAYGHPGFVSASHSLSAAESTLYLAHWCNLQMGDERESLSFHSKWKGLYNCRSLCKTVLPYYLSVSYLWKSVSPLVPPFYFVAFGAFSKI